MRPSRLPIALLVLAVFTGCSSSGPEFDPEVQPGVFEFDFETGRQGWEPIFVGVPKDKEGGEDLAVNEIESDHRALPDEVEKEGKALFAHGFTGTPGLGLFFRRRVTGLAPGTRYRVSFEVEIASDVGEGCFGTGGSPSSTRIHTVAVPRKPTRDVKERRLTDVYVFDDEATAEAMASPTSALGTIANGLPCKKAHEMGKPFRLKTLSSEPNFWTVTTGEKGEVWLLVGSITAFNGKVSLYYNEITVRFEKVND